MHEQLKLNCSLKKSCLDAIAKKLQKATISLSQGRSDGKKRQYLWTDSRENSQWRFLRKQNIDIFRIWLKSAKHNRQALV